MTRKLLKNAIFIDFHTHNIGPVQGCVNLYSYAPNLKFPRPQNTGKEEFFSIGLHPWNLNNNSLRDHLKEIREFACENHCLLIGESGLDRKIQADMELQKKVFIRHIELSEELEKPLIIHCVGAFSDIMAIYKEAKPKMPWIIHDFNGNAEMIKQGLKYNFYFCIGRRFITSPQSKIAQAIKEIPLDRLFFETDDQNEYSIRDIYTAFASKADISLEELKTQILSNFTKVTSTQLFE